MSDQDNNQLFIRLVLDVLKPHKPSIVELARALIKIKGMTKVSITTREIDAETETVQIIIEGMDLNYQEVLKILTQLSASVHSIDVVEVSRKYSVKLEKT